MQEQLPRGELKYRSLFLILLSLKEKIEEENYLTPLTQPSPRLGRGLKNIYSNDFKMQNRKS